MLTLENLSFGVQDEKSQKEIIRNLNLTIESNKLIDRSIEQPSHKTGFFISRNTLSFHKNHSPFLEGRKCLPALYRLPIPGRPPVSSLPWLLPHKVLHPVHSPVLHS